MEKHPLYKNAKQKRILSLGIGQSNFLLQLYGELKKRNAELSFSIDGFKDISGDFLKKNNTVFDKFYDFQAQEIRRRDRIQFAFKLLFSKIFWKLYFFERTQGKGWKSFTPYFEQQLEVFIRVKKFILPLKYHVYHFHYCIKDNLSYVHYLPKNSKIICSFWGSDLYRNNSKRNNYYVTQALLKSTVITIQTPEMGLDLFEKHGNFITKKTVYAQFATSPEIYDSIDNLQCEEQTLNLYKNSLGIKKNKLVLTIGYNARKEFNQIEILRHISKFPFNLKKKIVCILPLTYGRKEAFLQELERKIYNCDFEIVTLNEYMMSDEIARLRLITDIQIQLPVSDALSGSITEVLYAGNRVIAGTWLPYAIYERNDIHLNFVENFEELQMVLSAIINEESSTIHEIESSKEKIRNTFFPDTTSIPWLKIYDSF